MAQPSVLTAITLPGVTTAPSPNCLQWSGDGQAILVSRTAIYILTPQLGVNIGSSMHIKQSFDKNKTDSRKSVEWLRTMIEWDKDSVLHQWPSDCQDWGAVSLGSLDHHFRSVACSPNNLTANAGCVLAVLTSNMDVSLWAAFKDHMTGVWTKLGDYRGNETSLELSNGTDARLYRTLQAQVTSIAWSTQADFSIRSVPFIDVSLLALGSRAGTVCLARYIGETDSKTCLQHTSLFSVADRWVTHLAWSSWMSSRSEQSTEAYLACGISDGSVVVVKVFQHLREEPNREGFIKEYKTSVSHEVLNDKACEATNKGITFLQWIETSTPNPFLVFSTPGQLHIWSSARSPNARNVRRVMALRAVKTSIGSTLLAPLSGIDYIRRLDVLVFSLADGSFHSVSHFSTAPTFVPGTHNPSLSAEALSAMSRSVFVKVEERQPGRTDVNKISGMVAFDSALAYAWIQETVQPASFDYKHDAKHSSTFVVARLWSGSLDEVLLDDIARLTIAQSPGSSPLRTLRSVFACLQDPATISRLHAQILGILKNPSLVVIPDAEPLPLWTGGLNPDFRSAFRKSLQEHLFRSHTFNSQHLSLSIAKFCQDYDDIPNEQTQFASVAETMWSAIWQQVLRTLIRHLTACATIISNTEVPFVLRIVVQALFPGTSADLGLEARELSAKVNQAIAGDYDLNTLGPEELCPACHAPVPFQNMLSGVCTNGHTWARCSITSFLLATPMVRTCVGCGCKALLPPPRDASGAHWLPTPLRNWIAEDLLDAVRRCLFCGHSFVTL